MRPSIARLTLAVAACALTLVALDLTFLGYVAADFYARTLGPLRATEVVVPAAVLFYLLYLGAVMVHAVVPSTSWKQAARRGAGLGLVAYGTWDLTNWAVIAGFPAALVPVDLSWGVFLTTTVSAVGNAVYRAAGPPASAPDAGRQSPRLDPEDHHLGRHPETHR